jgi:hypothetical protein
MITTLSLDDVPVYDIEKGYDWFRSADGLFEGMNRPWSHFFLRRWRWGKGGFYPILLLDGWDQKQDRWCRHPFRYNGNWWWHGGKQPIVSFEESTLDRTVYKAVMLFNRLYTKLM